jgi:hypothetical protein
MLKLAQAAGLAFAVTLALSIWALPHEHGGAIDARQHGYEHGYRDGYDHGREDHRANAGYDYQSEDYRRGDTGYDRYMGDHGEYKSGYREGYVAGYDDGFYGRAGRFDQIYGTENGNYPDRSRGYDRDDDVYERHGYGYSDVAYDISFRDGLEAGQNDRGKGKDFRPEKHDRYEDADHGYRKSYGDKNDYKRRYRQGFSAGYEDAFGRR